MTAVTLWIPGALYKALQLDDAGNRQLLDLTILECRTAGFGHRMLITVENPARLRQWCLMVGGNDTYDSSWKRAAETTLNRLNPSEN